MFKKLFFIALIIFSNFAFPEVSVDMSDKSVVYVAIFENGKFAGNGSGFVVAPNVVVTNWHVAGEHPVVILTPGEKDKIKPFKSQKLWGSKEKDLVFLFVEGLSLQPIPLAEKVPDKGQEIIAIGYPGVAERSVEYSGLESTLSRGVVGRVLEANWSRGDKSPDKESYKIIQHNASINQGNSGGPLLDSCGRVVGVNTRKAFSIVTNLGQSQGITSQTEGIFYALSIEPVLKQLKLIGIQPIVGETACESISSKSNTVGVNNKLIQIGLLLALICGVIALIVSFRKNRVVTETYTQFLRRKTKKDDSVHTQLFERSKYLLEGTDSEGNPLSFKIPYVIGEEIIIGRDANYSKLVVNDKTVSRKHAALIVGIGGVKVKDLGSTNGTYVDFQSVNQADTQIMVGQCLTLGKVSLFLKSI